MLTLLEQQARLERMARIVGRDALPPGQQVTMLCADLLAEAILRQSAFSPVDRYCSPARQTAMLRLMMRFIELAADAAARGVAPRAIAALPLLPRLARLGEDYGEQALDGLKGLGREVEDAFAALVAEPADAR
jgi:V/A-type H+/Na+-transporting ATPase subunit A